MSSSKLFTMTRDTNRRGKTNKSYFSIRILSLWGKQCWQLKQATCAGLNGDH